MSTFFTVSQAALCPTNVAESSFYNTPHWKDYCKTSWSKCSKKTKDAFYKVINDRGSGIMPNRQVRYYNGKSIAQGKCDTTFGAAGKCMIPYISVAADPKYYRMGDIIDMPSLKGRVIMLPNGQRMIHPGYFIVADKGFDIKGPNRFDFYTGTATPWDRDNIFGYHGGFKMGQKSDCSDRKTFAVIPRKTPQADTALASIENSLYEARSTRNIASIGFTQSTPRKGTQ